MTEDTEKKKQKKPKKISNTHNSITGFEEVFEQFATPNVKISKNTMSPLNARQSEIPDDKKLDVSATQVRLIRKSSQQLCPLIGEDLVSLLSSVTVQITFVSILHKYLLN